MISLIIPTKGRSNKILTTIKNIIDLSSHKIDLEIFIIYDLDDILTKQTLDSFHSENRSIYSIGKEHSDYLNRDYYNATANKCYGKYIWAIADDVNFLTRHWDNILISKVEEYLKDKSDRISYISVKEINTQAKHPCFHIITKEAFESLGMYFHPELLSWGADRCLYELYNGINRILYIPEIEIEHISYHDGKALYDETAKSMKERFFRNLNCHNEICQNIIPKQINYLKTIIK